MTSTVTYYQTRRNADTNEGRGPMVNDRAFVHYKDAAAYIDEQPGVQGHRRKWSEAKYGDWDIQEVKVHTGPFDLNEDKRQKALSKLTAEERKLLGL